MGDSTDRMPPGQNFFTAGMDQQPEKHQQPQGYFQSMPVPLMTLTPMSLHVLAQARLVAGQGQQQFAVVLAQAACELRTEDAFIELMRHRHNEALGDALLDFVSTTSLGNSRLRKVFTALTGDDPAQAPWWAAWIKSYNLRHDVAHAGAQVTSGQATTAIDSAADFIAHVTSPVEKARAQ